MSEHDALDERFGEDLVGSSDSSDDLPSSFSPSSSSVVEYFFINFVTREGPVGVTESFVTFESFDSGGVVAFYRFICFFILFFWLLESD